MIPYYVMIIDPFPSSKLDIRKYLEKEGAHVSEMIFISSLGGKSEDIRIPKPYNFEKIIEFFFNEGEI